MRKSTARKRASKQDRPEKPRPDFPLFPHRNGSWAKKVKGKLFYFGRWADDPKGEAALDEWTRQKDDLLAGKKPREKEDERLTVKELVNQFLHAKKGQVATDEMTQRTWDDYRKTSERMTRVLGREVLVDDLRPDDFEKLKSDIAKKWGPVAMSNEIQRIRVICNFAYKAFLVDRPVRFGPHFRRPSKKVLRQARNERGPKMLEPDQIRALLDAANPQVKAMLLLACNCAFGNADVARLPLSALDLDGGLVTFPRPKTGIQRRCWLWPETVLALRIALEKRPTPKTEDAEDKVFVTKRGACWTKGGTANPVAAEALKLMNRPRCPECGTINKRRGEACACGWEAKDGTGWEKIHRRGLGFYVLRHVFRTIADEARDAPAVDYIMGHAREDMASIYRERISDDRLRAVAEHVRNWLFSPAAEAKAEEAKRAS